MVFELSEQARQFQAGKLQNNAFQSRFSIKGEGRKFVTYSFVIIFFFGFFSSRIPEFCYSLFELVQLS